MNRISLQLLLLKRIARMKRKLIETANNTGIGSTQTIKCSQDLDKLINLQMKYFPKKESRAFIIAS
jgi:hypothetical protein